MFHYTNIVKVRVSDTRDGCADTVKESLDDIDVDKVSWNDDPDDPDAIEIVVTGRFKKDAFKRYLDEDLDKTNPTKDRFDDAKPF